MQPNNHTLKENIFALLLCVGQVSLAIYLFNVAGLLTGGTAGFTLFMTRIVELSFGQIFFLVNLPFYVLALIQMGWRFTLNTFAAVALMSLTVDHLPYVLDINHLEPAYAALMGGALIGLGSLGIFRHNMSFGGVNILAFFLQERYGIRAGKVQMVIDCCIVGLSIFFIDFYLIALSILGAVITNLVLVFNHVPGRYQANVAS